MELGIGIHGEPGRRREQLGTAREIVEAMVEAVVGDLAPAAGAKVLAFVNGIGGTPLIELYLLYGEMERQLAPHGLDRHGGWSAATSRRWRWPASRSRCSSSTTS